MKLCLSKHLLFATVVSGIFFSCQQSNVQPHLPATLTLRSYLPKNDFRVFSQGGEVTDPTSIASFIRTSGMQNVTYSFGPEQNSSRTMTFINDTAFRVGMHEEYSYTKLSDGFLFRKKDFNTNSTSDQILTLITPFLKYPEMIANGNGSYTYQRQFAGYGDKSLLTVPGIDFLYGKRNEATGAFIGNYGSFGNANEFNFEGIKTLGPRDTIIIRETFSTFTIERP